MSEQTAGGADAPEAAGPTATWSRLRDGGWGLRVTGPVGSGSRVTARRADGTTSVEVVGRVIWRGDGVTLATVQAPARPSGGGGYARSRSRRWAPCGYPGCSPSYCDECDGGGRYS